MLNLKRYLFQSWSMYSYMPKRHQKIWGDRPFNGHPKDPTPIFPFFEKCFSKIHISSLFTESENVKEKFPDSENI